MKKYILLVVVLLNLLLIACGAPPDNPVSDPAEGETAPNTPVETDTTTDTAYPATDITSLTDGYPAPSDASEENVLQELGVYTPPAVTITDTSKGSIVGRLVNNQLNVPMPNVKVFLGTKEPLNGTDSFVVTMQEQGSPSSVTDENGYFVISDVDPESYGLIVSTPIGTKLLADLATDEALYVDIVGGELTDAGDVRFSFP